jgi:hypothetical protein
MVYKGFEAVRGVGGEQNDFLNLSKGRDILGNEKIEYAEIAVVKLANSNAFTGVSGTSKIEIFKGEKKVTTLEVSVKNPIIGGYRCCITENGEEIESKQCLPNDKEILTSKRGFSILKEPQWKKFDSGDVRFCRIVIYRHEMTNEIAATPDAQKLTEELSRQNSYYAAEEEDEDDDE